MEPAPVEFEKSKFESPSKKVKREPRVVVSFRDIKSDNVPSGTCVRFRIAASKSKEFLDKKGDKRWVVFGVAFDLTMCPMQFSAFSQAADAIRHNTDSTTVFEASTFALDLTPTISKAHTYKFTVNNVQTVDDTIPSPFGPFTTFSAVFPRRDEEVLFNFIGVVTQQFGTKYAFTFHVTDKTMKNAEIKFCDSWAACHELERQQLPFVVLVHNATKTLGAEIHLTNKTIVEFNPDTIEARDLVKTYGGGPLRPVMLSVTPALPPPPIGPPPQAVSHAAPQPMDAPPQQYLAPVSDAGMTSAPVPTTPAAPATDDSNAVLKRRSSKSATKPQ